MFSQFGLIIFLSACVSIKGNTKIELNINDEKQPLVMAISESTDFLYAVPPKWNSNNPEKLIFEFENHKLISACPSLDQETYELGLLYFNANSVTTCAKPFKPIIMEQETQISCGLDGNGLYHEIGYSVYEDHPTTQQIQGFIIHDIWLHDICYSRTHGTLFTMHELHPGQNVKSFEDWKKNNEDYKIRSEFTSESTSNNNINEGTSHNVEIQFVPFDDMTAMPWKMSTLYDFNFYFANQHISESLEKINQFLRNFANKNSIYLDVFSGVKNSSNQVEHQSSTSTQTQSASYYWKMIRFCTQGIILVVPDQEPKSNPPLCKNICNRVSLQELEKEIPDLLCCKVTKSLTETFGIIIHDDSGQLNLKIDEVFDFNLDVFNFDVFSLSKRLYRSIMNRFKQKVE